MTDPAAAALEPEAAEGGAREEDDEEELESASYTFADLCGLLRSQVSSQKSLQDELLRRSMKQKPAPFHRLNEPLSLQEHVNILRQRVRNVCYAASTTRQDDAFFLTGEQGCCNCMFRACITT